MLTIKRKDDGKTTFMDDTEPGDIVEVLGYFFPGRRQ